MRKALSFFLLLTLCITLMPSTVLSAAKKEKIYVVKKGDNLYKIGKNLDLDWTEIAKQNKIKDPYIIYIGDELKLPLTEEEKKAVKAAEKEKENKDKAVVEEKDGETTKVVQETGEKESSSSEIDSSEQTTSEDSKPTTSFSNWAMDDLVTGDSYGIYPLTWYNGSLTAPIKAEQMKVLVEGLSAKIKLMEAVTPSNQVSYKLKENMTVEEVLGVFYSVLSSNEYTQDLGLNKKYSYTAYMQEYGIYTGKNGELDLKDTCSVEQACVFATRIVTYVYDALDSASKGFLWEVKKDGNTAYLLGSIHVANHDIYPFSSKMLEAYESSDALVVEVNMFDTVGTQAFVALASYSDGTTLKDHVSEETYKKSIEIGKMLGFTENIMATLKPWYISNLLTALSTSDGDIADASKAIALGIDISFMTNATMNEKPILEIEGYAKQGKMFDDFSEGLQEYLLINSIESFSKAKSGLQAKDSNASNQIETWLNYWHKGDADGFKKSFNIEDEILGDTFNNELNSELNLETKAYMEEYFNALLTKRDKGMAEYIDKLLQGEGSHTYFVVVGAFHYISDYSVLTILEEKGYEITQIK